MVGRPSSPPLPIDKAPDRIAEMFDAIAARYDLLNRLLSGGLDRIWRVRAVTELELSGTETVLDLCTGTADLAIAAALRPGGARRVVALDFASEMLRRGYAKLRTRGLRRRVRLIRGDATCVPLVGNSVDAVTIGFGIRNVSEPRKALGEIYRVLRPGGHFAILEFGEPTPRVLRMVYSWYFQHVLPWVGRALSGHVSAYTYLPSSVGLFHGPPAFCELLRTSGFSEIRAVPLSFGIVYLYIGAKESEFDRDTLKERDEAAIIN